MGYLNTWSYAARMRMLRRRVRGFFALQSVLMLISGGMKLAKSLSVESVSAASAEGMIALMFAGAWWTTRKPSEYRNSWAVAASLICVVTGTYIVWAAYQGGGFSRSGAVSAILGLAGLYLYSQGGRAPHSIADAPVTDCVEAAQ